MTTPQTTTPTPADEQQLAAVAHALAHVGLSWTEAGHRPAALYRAMAEELDTRGLLTAPTPTAPDRPHVLDAAGRRVHEGDTVGGTTSGRYQATLIGPVIKLGKGQVKIRVEHSNGVYPKTGDEKWISTARIFLITPDRAAR